MIDLMGEYRHKVDTKGRVSLPAKFRRAFSEESQTEADDSIDLVVSLNPTGECLYVFTPDGFNKWVSSFFERDGSFNSRNVNHTAARSVLKSRAREIEVDSAGRINLTAAQREAVGIGKEAVFIGNTGYVEIWSPERWDEFKKIDLAALLFDPL